MLVLSRNVGETILIGGDVSISILSVKGGQVRIGITAPKSTSVYREEVSKKILADENASSIKASLSAGCS